MPIVEKRSSKAAERGSPLPRWIPPQLTQLSDAAPSGPQWLHEIKLDGFRMAARIDRGQAQLLTRTGLDWTDKYPSVVAALAQFGRRRPISTANCAASATMACRAFRRPRRRATASAACASSFTLSTSCILTGATPPACRSIERKALLEPLVAGHARPAVQRP